MCLCQDEHKPRLKISLSPQGIGKIQTVEVSDLQPGSLNSLTFDILNELTEKVDLENIKLSCGCMDAAPSGKSIEPSKSIELRVDLRLAAFDTKVSRKFRIVDDQARTWDVGLICSPVKIFKKSYYPVELSPNDREIQLGVEFEPGFQCKAPSAAQWVCSSTNAIVTNTEISGIIDASGVMTGIKLVAKVNPSRFGLQR
jgi:Protein of unknown function (DUF1573)